MGSYWIWAGQAFSDYCPYEMKRRDIRRQRHRIMEKEDGHVKREAEVGML